MLAMMKQKLNWKRPLFYLLLPIFLIMVFLGFPLPIAPPPAIKATQEQSETVKKRRKRTRFPGIVPGTPDDAED
ncbi:hypothetical protein [Massilia eurypsychrophila]|jgi:hypothetical protein|nr:hypothetical protein [Massilia eurypsychrophila]